MSAVVVGRIEFGAGGREKWAQTSFDERRYGPWEPPFQAPSARPYATAGAFLDDAARLDAAAGAGFFELSGGDRAELFGVIAPERVDEWLKPIAIAAHAAHAAGGRGDVWVLLLGAGAAHLSLGKKEVRTELVDPQAILAGEPLVEAAVLDAMEWMTWAQADPSRTRASHRAELARFYLPEAVDDAERAALSGARALDDRALAAALDAVKLHERGRTARALLGEPDAARRALDDAAPAARTLAVGLLAHADAAKGEPIALRLLDAPALPQRLVAVRALRGTRAPAAVDALVGRLAIPSREADEARASLAASPDDLVRARVAELLAQTCDPGRWADLPPGRRVDPARHAAADREIERALGVLGAAALVRPPGVIATLLALFEDPRPSALYLRPKVIEALATLGGPEVEARGEELQLARMGMGRGLNQDLARRAELLGQTLAETQEDYAKFEGLDRERCERLLDERFLAPTAQQNDAPDAATFFRFLLEFPEARAHGYSIGPGRADYRVMIEGLSCELGPVAEPARREALREAFAALCEGANELDTDGDSLHAWWT